MSASNLVINLYDAPQAFSLNECLDVIVELTNIGASTATGGHITGIQVKLHLQLFLTKLFL
jgi:hypothetical protein